MPLTFTGDHAASASETVFRAKDANGKVVIVRVSTEVLQDYEQAEALDRASLKFDGGAFEITNGIPTVRVYTDDMAATFRRP